MLLGGFAVMLVANAVLLQVGLAPLDRLSRRMATVDLLKPGQRLPVAGHGGVPHLIRAFNDMLDRLEARTCHQQCRALSAQESGTATDRPGTARRSRPEPDRRTARTQTRRRTVPDRAAWRPAPCRRRPGTAWTRYGGSRAGCGRVCWRISVCSALLTALATELSTHTGSRRTSTVRAGLPALDEQAELVIYRVAQEGLTNVARHADATPRRARPGGTARERVAAR